MFNISLTGLGLQLALGLGLRLGLGIKGLDSNGAKRHAHYLLTEQKWRLLVQGTGFSTNAFFLSSHARFMPKEKGMWPIEAKCRIS